MGRGVKDGCVAADADEILATDAPALTGDGIKAGLLPVLTGNEYGTVGRCCSWRNVVRDTLTLDGVESSLFTKEIAEM